MLVLGLIIGIYSYLIFIFGLLPSIIYNGALNNYFWISFISIPIVCIIFNANKIFNSGTNLPLLICGAGAVIIFNIFSFLITRNLIAVYFLKIK